MEEVLYNMYSVKVNITQRSEQLSLLHHCTLIKELILAVVFIATCRSLF